MRFCMVLSFNLNVFISVLEEIGVRIEQIGEKWEWKKMSIYI